MNIGELIKAQTKPFFSLEFFPPKTEDALNKFYNTVSDLQALQPLFMSVTYGAFGTSQDNSLNITEELNKKFSCEVMAHLTCIGASNENMHAHLEALKKIGINNILALRGDLPKDVQMEDLNFDFTHASDLVRFIKKNYPDMGVSVAGYPTAHPESLNFTNDWRWTVAKIREGADFVITQLFFDVREYFSFVDRLQDMGVNVPIIPGVLPVQSFDSLRKTLSMCGANIPGKLYLEMEEAFQRGGNAAIKEVGIKFAVKQIQDLIAFGAPGVHLYTLNQSSTCLRIADEVGLR